MDRSDVIYLISIEKSQDDYGRWIPSETRKKVYCQVNSITRSEFYDAGRNGLNPEYEFTLFFGDYSGETIVEYNGKRYAVYRVYRAKSDVIELYAERQGGTNGGS